MAAAKRRNYHVGGTQEPMFLPEATWQPPASPPDLAGLREVAVDTEFKDDSMSAGNGPGWARGAGWLCGVSLAWAGGKTYLPLRHPETQCLGREAVRGCIRGLYESRTRLVFMNAPIDMGWIWRDLDLEPPKEPGRLDDVGLMAMHVDEGRKGFDLDTICQWQGLPGKDETLLREVAAAYGMDPKKDLWRFPARYVGGYAEDDAEQTLGLAHRLRPVIQAEETVDAYRTDADLMACCFEMQRRGLRVSTDNAEQRMEQLARRRDEVLREMSRRWGRPVTLENVRSWRWMQGACEAEGVKFPNTKPSRQKDGSFRGGGRPSFSADWMRVHPHWLPSMACAADRLNEGAEKFLGNFILSFAHRGRVYPNINQFLSEDGGTRSHRFSYSCPPWQQAPGSKMEELDDIGAAIVYAFRGSILPEEGEVWCSPDWSQQEYRLIVHYAFLNGLTKADEAVRRYREDPTTDFHNLVVELTGLSRRRSKDCNFAKAFGAGIPKFAEMTGMTVQEAGDAMEQYDRELPFVSQLGKRGRDLANGRGYMVLIDGARMHYNLWEPAWRERDERWEAPCGEEEARRKWPGRRLRRAFTQKAMNNLIQGSAARQTKKAMLAAYQEGIVPLMQMHDELPDSVSSPEQGERLAEIMRDVVKLSVPVLTDIEYGPSWGDARKVRDKDKRVLYGATFDEARRLEKEGKWW